MNLVREKTKRLRYILTTLIREGNRKVRIKITNAGIEKSILPLLDFFNVIFYSPSSSSSSCFYF